MYAYARRRLDGSPGGPIGHRLPRLDEIVEVERGPRQISSGRQCPGDASYGQVSGASSMPASLEVICPGPSVSNVPVSSAPMTPRTT